jgi:hypothetical protein
VHVSASFQWDEADTCTLFTLAQDRGWVRAGGARSRAGRCHRRRPWSLPPAPSACPISQQGPIGAWSGRSSGEAGRSAKTLHILVRYRTPECAAIQQPCRRIGYWCHYRALTSRKSDPPPADVPLTGFTPQAPNLRDTHHHTEVTKHYCRSPDCPQTRAAGYPKGHARCIGCRSGGNRSEAPDSGVMGVVLSVLGPEWLSRSRCHGTDTATAIADRTRRTQHRPKPTTRYASPPGLRYGCSGRFRATPSPAALPSRVPRTNPGLRNCMKPGARTGRRWRSSEPTP